MTQDTSAKFDEISRTSLMMSLFSSINKEEGYLENIPIIRGGQGLIKDKTAMLKIEEAFGQLNLPDLFKSFNFFLTVASYIPYKLKEDLAISPYLYTIKATHGNTFGMNLLMTPWSDINLSQLSDRIYQAIKDYSGVFRRSSIPVKNVDSLIDYRKKECSEAANFLIGYIYYLLFIQRQMIGGVEKTKKESELIAVLFQRGTIQHVYMCLGECGHSYDNKKYPNGLEKCPNCGSRVSTSTIPIFVPKKVSVAFPPSLGEEEDISSNESSSKPGKMLLPIELVYLFQSSYLHPEIRLLFNRILPDIFQYIVLLPHRSSFQYINSNDDFLALYSVSRLDNDELLVVTGITDSLIRFPGTLSRMAMRLFVRDLNEGMKKGYTRNTIFKKSVLNEWFLSKWISLEEEGTPEPLSGWKNLVQVPEDEL